MTKSLLAVLLLVGCSSSPDAPCQAVTSNVCPTTWSAAPASMACQGDAVPEGPGCMECERVPTLDHDCATGSDTPINGSAGPDAMAWICSSDGVITCLGPSDSDAGLWCCP